MKFKSGDDVVHPTYGVGNILRLEERQFAEAELRLYYVLAIDKSTVWVPVHSDGSTILRTVTRHQELDQYRILLKSRPTALEHDHRRRRLDINERLKQGSFRALCEVVRDLAARGWYRQMSGTDAGLLKKLSDNLWREWAVAADMSMPEVIQEVGALLQLGRDVYKS
jgi:CarD family transcriptional regulator